MTLDKWERTIRRWREALRPTRQSLLGLTYREIDEARSARLRRDLAAGIRASRDEDDQ